MDQNLISPSFYGPYWFLIATRLPVKITSNSLFIFL